MFCKNCGANVADGSAFCANCGTAVEQQESAYAAPAAYTESPSYQPNAAQASLGRSILIFGILALALAGWGVVGLIFAIIAKKKIGQYLPRSTASLPVRQRSVRYSAR